VFFFLLLMNVGRGFSGVWVVSDSETIGVIVAVYDDQPYVHMLPITTVLSGIRAALPDDLKLAEVRVLSTESTEQSHYVPTQAQLRSNQVSGSTMQSKESHGVPKRFEVSELDGTLIPIGPLLTMCLMSFAIGLVGVSHHLFKFRANG
jgi:hypothetical protein